MKVLISDSKLIGFQKNDGKCIPLGSIKFDNEFANKDALFIKFCTLEYYDKEEDVDYLTSPDGTLFKVFKADMVRAMLKVV